MYKPISTRIQLNPPKSKRIRRNQPQSTCINPHHPISTQFNLNQPSTRINFAAYAGSCLFFKDLLICSADCPWFYTGNQENCCSASVIPRTILTVDEQIYEKDSLKMRLLSGETFVSPFWWISKNIAANCPLPKTHRKRFIPFGLKWGPTERSEN